MNVASCGIVETPHFSRARFASCLNTFATQCRWNWITTSALDEIARAVQQQQGCEMFQRLYSAVVVSSLVIGCSAAVDTSEGTDRNEGDLASVESASEALVFQTCGGFAGLLCPSGSACVDDPRDTCNPRTGGADCSGICIRTAVCPNPGGKKNYVINDVNQCKLVRIDCKPPATYFSDACGCGCKVP